MTQSKDVAGRNMGGPAAGQGAPRGGSAPGAGDVPLLPHPSSMAPPERPQAATGDTDEMQELLRKIASQIADAERRQGAALDGMRDRLSELAGQTEAAKAQVPPAMQPGLDSIEGRIAKMAETVDTVSRDIKASSAATVQHEPGGNATASKPAAAASATPSTATSASASMHVRGFGRGQVRGADASPGHSTDPVATSPVAPVAATPPALRSASSAVAKPSAMTLDNAAPGTSSKKPAPASDLDASGPWDQDAADALANIFSDDVAQTSPSPALAPAAVPASAAPPVSALARGVPPTGERASAVRHEPPAIASRPSSSPLAGSVLHKSPSAALPGAPAMPSAPMARQEPSAPAPVRPAVAATPSAAPAPQASAAPKPAAPAKPAMPPVGQAEPVRAPGSASQPAAVTPISVADRDWLNGRFADIASQLERSLRESRPDAAFATLGRRFDKLEASLATVVTSVQAGAGSGDGKVALQALESQVTALQGQIQSTVSRLEGLDALKADIATLGQRLAVLDRLEQSHAQLDSRVMDTRGDIGKLARMIEENSRSAMALANGAGNVADPRIDALHQLVETQVVERRDAESATVAVLQAIQGAIDGLSHRLHQFEGAMSGGAPIELEPQTHAAAASLSPSPKPVFASRALPSDLPLGHDDAEEPPVMRTRAARAEPPALRETPPQEPPAAQTEAAIPRSRRGLGNILRNKEQAAPPSEPGIAMATDRASRRPERPAPDRQISAPEAEDMIRTARRTAAAAAAAVQPASAAEDELATDVDVETIASRLPGQGKAKAKAAKGGFFTFEKAGARPVHVVGLVALLAAGAGMLYGTMAERPQPAPIRLDKPKAAPGKMGAIDTPDTRTAEQTGGDAASDRRPQALASGQDQGIASGDVRRASASGDEAGSADAAAFKSSDDADVAAMRSGASGGLTTGILVDSGAPMPSPRDLQRYSEEQRMARISSHLGDKVVQKIEQETSTPVSLVPDGASAGVRPAGAAAAAATPVGSEAQTSAAANAAGLPPAQIGPMSLRVAAAKGDPSAEFEVASRYAQGKGVAKDFAKAAEWYQRAASRGSAPAQYRLGGLYERGIGVKVDTARARTWYKRAAEQGNVKAMHNLAVMFTQRDAGEPDYASANQWFARAAAHGLADSQFNLGILHENGMGVPKSTTEAYKWYALATERGDPEAAKRRDAIASKLAPAELDGVRQQIAKWRPAALDPNANDPYMAGQAWRSRQGDDGAQQGASAGAARPAARTAAQPEEAEVIDLSSATMDAQMRNDNAARPTAMPSGATAVMNNGNPAMGADAAKAKRKVPRVQQSADDVEKMLTQYGYNPNTLKKARPGGADETPVAKAE